MDLFFGLVALFFLSFFEITFLFLKILYFNNFILFYFSILSFFLFLTFLLSRVADRVLVLRLGVNPEPLRWESQFQDIDPPETSQPHVI